MCLLTGLDYGLIMVRHCGARSLQIGMLSKCMEVGRGEVPNFLEHDTFVNLTM